MQVFYAGKVTKSEKIALSASDFSFLLWVEGSFISVFWVVRDQYARDGKCSIFWFLILKAGTFAHSWWWVAVWIHNNSKDL